MSQNHTETLLAEFEFNVFSNGQLLHIGSLPTVSIRCRGKQTLAAVRTFYQKHRPEASEFESMARCEGDCGLRHADQQMFHNFFNLTREDTRLLLGSLPEITVVELFCSLQFWINPRGVECGERPVDKDYVSGFLVSGSPLRWDKPSSDVAIVHYWPLQARLAKQPKTVLLQLEAHLSHHVLVPHFKPTPSSLIAQTSNMIRKHHQIRHTTGKLLQRLVHTVPDDILLLLA